jgi:UDP-N-acetylmuramate dehydrogenase
MENIIDEHLWHEIVSPDAFSGEVRFMEPMKNYTSLRMGGPADIFASPEDVVSLKNMLSALKEKGIPFMPVGGGTNLLVRDGGIDGVVVSLRDFRRIEVIRDEKDNVMLFVEAGLPLQKLVSFAKENGYSGIEGLIGIPGSLGGAVSGNAGAFSYEIKDVLVSVTLMHRDGNLDKVDACDLGLGYRSSRIPEGSVILSAIIGLKKDIKEDVSKRMEDFLKEKRERQPIGELSAGCVFKNPEGAYAGKLIDEAGCKGMKVGDVEVSNVHANFFINKGDATASDFIKLMDNVREKVIGIFSIELEPEIRIVGRE